MLWEEETICLSCSTEVQGLTLMGEAKKCLRAETKRKHKFTRIRNTIARVFLVVTGQSLGDKSLGFNGLLDEIARATFGPTMETDRINNTRINMTKLPNWLHS